MRKFRRKKFEKALAFLTNRVTMNPHQEFPRIDMTISTKKLTYSFTCMEEKKVIRKVTILVPAGCAATFALKKASKELRRRYSKRPKIVSAYVCRIKTL